MQRVAAFVFPLPHITGQRKRKNISVASASRAQRVVKRINWAFLLTPAVAKKLRIY
jgi:hypothetical protein